MQQMADKATRHSQSDRPTDLIYAHDPLFRNPFTHAICLGFPFPMNYDLGQWGVVVKTLAFPLPKSHDRRQLGESDGKPNSPRTRDLCSLYNACGIIYYVQRLQLDTPPEI